MKGQRFHRRIGFAIAGLRTVWRSEASFRSQSLLAGGTIMAIAVVGPGALWVALVVLTIGAVLAAEALNAAVEYLADAVRPDHHPLIGAAKDAAAGAVLIVGLAAIGVAAATVYGCLM